MLAAGLSEDNFSHLVALTLDVEAVGGVLYAHALEVEVFNGSVLVEINGYILNSCGIKESHIEEFDCGVGYIEANTLIVYQKIFRSGENSADSTFIIGSLACERYISIKRLSMGNSEITSSLSEVTA